MRQGTLSVIMIIAVLTCTISIAAGVFYHNLTARQKLVVATTTSLFDTGLLDTLESRFEARHNIELHFVSVGTGIAIEFAQKGDVDMILVHSPQSEFAFLEAGWGVNRKIVAYNFFNIVGPKDDPAGIQGLSPTEAMVAISEAGRNGQALWISRGDNSGTHSKETQLWTAAGISLNEIRDETSWFIETGSGMANTLKTANQLNAYTLTDVGTFLAFETVESLPHLIDLVSEGQQLLNVYSAIAVNPSSHPQVNFAGTIIFTEYLSKEGQHLIENYGVDKYGKSLFHPTVDILDTDKQPMMAQMIRDYAFFNGSECPLQYRYGNHELYG